MCFIVESNIANKKGMKRIMEWNFCSIDFQLTIRMMIVNLIVNLDEGRGEKNKRKNERESGKITLKAPFRVTANRQTIPVER